MKKTITLITVGSILTLLLTSCSISDTPTCGSDGTENSVNSSSTSTATESTEATSEGTARPSSNVTGENSSPVTVGSADYTDLMAQAETGTIQYGNMKIVKAFQNTATNTGSLLTVNDTTYNISPTCSTTTGNVSTYEYTSDQVNIHVSYDGGTDTISELNVYTTTNTGDKQSIEFTLGSYGNEGDLTIKQNTPNEGFYVEGTINGFYYSSETLTTENNTVSLTLSMIC